MSHRIIIDTDPGQDDAIAILLALASPEIEVLGITSVAGNVPLALTTKNALKIARARRARRRAGLRRRGGAAGAPARHRRGRARLDRPRRAGPAGADAHGARRATRSTSSSRPCAASPRAAVTLCVLGPMTNIAMAFARAPEIVGRVARIVAMGGAWSEGGNTTPAAEFNIFADPHAAHAVFRSGRADRAAPARRHAQDPDRARPGRGLPRGSAPAPARAVAEMMEFFERFDEAKYGTDGGPLHDPNVIAWLLRPEIYAGREVNVEVETGSELTMGQTVIDWWGVTGRPTERHRHPRGGRRRLLRAAAGADRPALRRARRRLSSEADVVLAYWEGSLGGVLRQFAKCGQCGSTASRRP